MAKRLEIKIFNEDDVQEIKQARRTLDEVLPLIDKAEKCGVDCQVFREVRDQKDDELKNLEAEFMKPSQIIKG